MDDMIDIIPPQAPPSAVTEAASALGGWFLLLVVMAVVAWITWHRRHDLRARLALLRLRRRHARGELDDRQAAFALAAVLQARWDRAPLPAEPPGKITAERWQRLVDDLEHLRFQPGAEVEMAALWPQALQCLKEGR